jgi:hypothetical protein
MLLTCTWGPGSNLGQNTKNTDYRFSQILSVYPGMSGYYTKKVTIAFSYILSNSVFTIILASPDIRLDSA